MIIFMNNKSEKYKLYNNTLSEVLNYCSHQKYLYLSTKSSSSTASITISALINCCSQFIFCKCVTEICNEIMSRPFREKNDDYCEAVIKVRMQKHPLTDCLYEETCAEVFSRMKNKQIKNICYKIKDHSKIFNMIFIIFSWIFIIYFIIIIIYIQIQLQDEGYYDYSDSDSLRRKRIKSDLKSNRNSSPSSSETKLLQRSSSSSKKTKKLEKSRSKTKKSN
ncbi:hypothetical protein DERP_003708 [Dermatophagoides pteronyssinus]|uniref:Uncharacterized protein n=1 Tax=Dermatophagoides pteronyssinus TaxID=6956 RepID=A0ABQ8JLD7_DERPT|nr:hypothetical protein DERP_003708 [Dermatophagoides pteronyssinus]